MSQTRSAKVPGSEAETLGSALPQGEQQATFGEQESSARTQQSTRSGLRRAVRPAPPPKEGSTPRMVAVKRVAQPAASRAIRTTPTPMPAMPAMRPSIPTLPEEDLLEIVGPSAIRSTPPQA